MGKRKKYRIDLKDSVIWYPPPNGFHYDPTQEIMTKKGGYSSGSNHYLWAGGRTKDNRGYITVYKPDHPYSNYKYRVYEHRLVMESKLGRYLKSYEIVHHIDEDKSNNEPSNLELTSREEHRSNHSRKNMSDRRCLLCGSADTYKNKNTKYLIWFKEGDEFVCYYCGLKRNREIRNHSQNKSTPQSIYL